MELGSAGKLDQFMQTFVARATSFLGFRRSFIGLLDGEGFRLRWGVQENRPQPLEIMLPSTVGVRALRQKQVFQTEDAAAIPGANVELINSYKLRQILAVPLIGSTGEVLGMFGVLDRVQGTTGVTYNEDVPVFELPRSPLLSIGELQHLDTASGLDPFLLLFDSNPEQFAMTSGSAHAAVPREEFARFFMEVDAIARKAAATLSSTGTPAVFMHPVEGVHGDHADGARRDQRLHGGWIYCPDVGTDVGKHRLCAGVAHRMAGRWERIVRHDDLVADASAEREHRQMQRRCAVVHGQGVRHTADLGEAGLALVVHQHGQEWLPVDRFVFTRRMRTLHGAWTLAGVCSKCRKRVLWCPSCTSAGSLPAVASGRTKT
jgi:hypothetical protein